MNISNKFSHWVLALTAVVLAAISATLIFGRIQYNEILLAEQEEAEEVVVFGADGKQNGQPLSEFPIKITDKFIFYEDRVVERYYYSEYYITPAILATNAAFDLMPEDVNKYLLVVPSRILYEDNTTTTDSDALQTAINELYANIPPKSTPVDVRETLGGKKDEYIYFRTDEAWTALGAYYAAAEFLKLKGIPIIPLSEYEEDRLVRYTGTYRSLDGAESARKQPDYVSFYVHENMPNSQSITVYEENSYYWEHESPTLALSRRSTDIFVGSHYSHSIIDGNPDKTESIIIIGDKQAKIFAPWLIPYYNKVCLIYPTYYNGNFDTMSDMIAEYNVTDFLMMQSPLSTRCLVGNQKMYHLFAY